MDVQVSIDSNYSHSFSTVFGMSNQHFLYKGILSQMCRLYVTLGLDVLSSSAEDLWVTIVITYKSLAELHQSFFGRPVYSFLTAIETPLSLVCLVRE